MSLWTLCSVLTPVSVLPFLRCVLRMVLIITVTLLSWVKPLAYEECDDDVKYGGKVEEDSGWMDHLQFLCDVLGENVTWLPTETILSHGCWCHPVPKLYPKSTFFQDCCS